jgi:hypothetical protein
MEEAMMLLLTMASKGHGAAPTSTASLRSELNTRLTSVPSLLPPLPLPSVDLLSHALGKKFQRNFIKISEISYLLVRSEIFYFTKISSLTTINQSKLLCLYMQA